MDNFQYFSTKTYCDPSLELSQRDGSNEGSQCMFSLRNKKNYLWIIPLTIPYLEPCIIIKYSSYLRLQFGEFPSLLVANYWLSKLHSLKWLLHRFGTVFIVLVLDEPKACQLREIFISSTISLSVSSM